MALKITPEFMHDWFGPLNLTPDLLASVRDYGPGGIVTADLVKRRYDAVAPADQDLTDNGRLIAYTHADVEKVLASTGSTDAFAWKRAAWLATEDVRSTMHEWPPALFVFPTAGAMRQALHVRGFAPHRRPRFDDEDTVVDTYVYTADPRIVVTTAMPAFTGGSVTCEATIMLADLTPQAMASGFVSESSGAHEGAAGILSMTLEILAEL